LMMIFRPAGVLPDERRREELREGEAETSAEVEPAAQSRAASTS